MMKRSTLPLLLLICSPTAFTGCTTRARIPPVIDAHIHIYDTNREGSATFLSPDRHKKIYYPHLADDFKEVASPAGVGYAIVVEASKRREDNFWLMAQVDESDNLLAFIANLDPRDPAFTDDLDRLAENSKFRGIRLRPKTKIDLSNDAVIAEIGALAERNLILELGGNDGSVEEISNIAHTYPNMNIIMNHMAGGRIRNGEIYPESWPERLKGLAKLPNVYCKISMLYGLSGETPAPTDVGYYKRFIDMVVQHFGPDRVIFGSNWTLSEMHGSYADMLNMYNAYLEQNPDLGGAQLYWENTLTAYGIEFPAGGFPTKSLTTD